MTRLKIILSLLAAAWLATACATPGGRSFASRNEAAFGVIQAGMTTDEVRSRLGTPDQTMPFPRQGTVAWDYRYQDAWGYQALMSITFGPDGLVASKTSQRLNDGGDHK
jgi:outer membrane protein assembly factor BamE (lipoprotein component of BamABCDE complex)